MPCLHSILQLGHEGALGDEGEEPSLHGVGHGDDETPEHSHLRHKEHEHLGREGRQRYLEWQHCWDVLSDWSVD